LVLAAQGKSLAAQQAQTEVIVYLTQRHLMGAVLEDMLRMVLMVDQAAVAVAQLTPEAQGILQALLHRKEITAAMVLEHSLQVAEVVEQMQ
jgi:hypothetical protein